MSKSGVARPLKYNDDVVLDRATDLFWKHGSDAVTIRDLEAALDLQAPSIYRRFASKDQLLVQCLDHYVEQTVSGRVRYFFDDAVDPLVGLRAFFTSVLRQHPDEDRLRGCLLTTTASRADLDPDVRAAVARGFETIEVAFRSQIERGITGGRIRPDLSVEATAKALLMSFQGLLLLARNGADDLEASVEATFAALALPR